MLRLRIQKKEISTTDWKKIDKTRSVSSYATSMKIFKKHSSFSVHTNENSSRNLNERQIAKVTQSRAGFLFKALRSTLISGSDDFWVIVSSNGVKKYRLSEGDIFRLHNQVFILKKIGNLSSSKNFGKKIVETDDIEDGGIGPVLKNKEKTIFFDDLETERFCRICQDTDDIPSNPLILPCLCKGSMGYVHFSCFKTWMLYKFTVKESGVFKVIEWEDIKCEQCLEIIPESFKCSDLDFDFLREFLPGENFLVFQSPKQINSSKNQAIIVDINDINKFFIKANGDFSLINEKLSHCFHIQDNKLFLTNYSNYIHTSILLNKQLNLTVGSSCLLLNNKTSFKLTVYKSYNLKTLFCSCFSKVNKS